MDRSTIDTKLMKLHVLAGLDTNVCYMQRGTLGASFNEGAFARPQQSGRVVLKVDRSQLQNGQAKLAEPDGLTAAEDEPKNGKGQ